MIPDKGKFLRKLWLVVNENIIEVAFNKDEAVLIVLKITEMPFNYGSSHAVARISIDELKKKMKRPDGYYLSGKNEEVVAHAKFTNEGVVIDVYDHDEEFLDSKSRTWDEF